jgi:glycosyltransferase involved in cell wall biosynthesis
LRLGLVIYGSLETISGGFLYDRMLVQHLRSRGDEVEVISLPWRAYGRGLLDNLSPSLRQRLEEARYDLLLQDELIHPSLFWLNRRLGRRRRRYPMVAIVHHLRCSEGHPPWQNRLFRGVERRYLDTMDGFICPSRATLQSVADLLGTHRPAVVAAPGGNRFGGPLTPEEISARAARTGPLRILFLGNLIPRKGLHLLLSALAQVKCRDWRLTAAGSLTMAPDYVRRLRRQVARAGFDSQVELFGPVVDEALKALLAGSHVLAVPSSYEGFGIVYLEGMGFGLPAIAGTAGGAVEIVSHGRDGFLVEPGDARALSQYLSQLLEDRGLLLTMSLAARERYLAHPTWADAGAAIHRFLHDFRASP